MERRVVVTGMGAITPIGNTVSEFWDSLKNGIIGIDFIKNIDVSDLKVKIAAEVKDFDPLNFMDFKDVKRNDKYVQFALAAANMAVSDCNGLIAGSQLGVIVGSGIGGLSALEEQIIKMDKKGASRVSPFFIPMAINNMAAGCIAIKYGAKGKSVSVVSACATSTHSIGEAYRSIKYGELDACIAGGSEASVTKIGIAGFSALSALSSKSDPSRTSIPFDLERDGFVMGEGAGIVILEELSHALERNAPIYAEITGYGATSDAYHITLPDPGGMEASRAIALALEESKISSSDVSYVNAHGTSTKANDKTETLVIKMALGDDAFRVPISSTKSMTGHMLGAAGAIETIATIKALQEDFVPPTVGLQINDPDCDLDYVPNNGRYIPMHYGLNISFGFGGHNAALCLKKWEGC